MLVAVILATNFGFWPDWLHKHARWYCICREDSYFWHCHRIFHDVISYFFISTARRCRILNECSRIIGKSLTVDFERFQVKHHAKVMHLDCPLQYQQIGTFIFVVKSLEYAASRCRHLEICENSCYRIKRLPLEHNTWISNDYSVNCLPTTSIHIE